MGKIFIEDVIEHKKKIYNNLEEARNMLIMLCNQSYFPSKDYDNNLSMKESLDFLLYRLETLNFKQKKLDKSNVQTKKHWWKLWK